MAHKTSRVVALFMLGFGGCSAEMHDTTPDGPVVTPSDAPEVQDAPPIPHYHYILDRLDLPASAGQYNEWSLDFDGVHGVNNVLSRLTAMLSNAGFYISTPNSTAINHGTTLTLIDLQTADFQNTPVAGVQILRGADPMPAPCNPVGTVGDQTCRRQFDGTAHFSIASDDPHDPQFFGAIQDGVFTTTLGDFALQLSLGVEPLIDLPLTDAHLQWKGTSATAIGSDAAGDAGAIISGAIRASDMEKFYAELAVAGQAMVARDCTGPVTTANTCGCAVASGGYAMTDFFDADHNCKITLAEIQNNPMLQSLMVSDVTLPDNTMALSFGAGMHAVPATFTLP